MGAATAVGQDTGFVPSSGETTKAWGRTTDAPHTIRVLERSDPVTNPCLGQREAPS